MSNGGREFGRLGVSSIFKRLGSKDPNLPQLSPGNAQPVVVIADLSNSLASIPYEPRAQIGVLVPGSDVSFFQLLALGQDIIVDSVKLTRDPEIVMPLEMSWDLTRMQTIPDGSSSVALHDPIQFGGTEATGQPITGLSLAPLPAPKIRIIPPPGTGSAVLGRVLWFIPSSFRLAIGPHSGVGTAQDWFVEVNWRELEQPVGTP